MVIYPTQRGWEDEDPFKTEFQDFKNINLETKIYVIIGSSFRDLEINEIFIDHLQRDKDNKLIVVSPSAS